ncbi:MAG TPA: SpoIID/LytB domain-containing protein [Solirubrobacterales bacterium]|nr:SpoIID/LytB domain-containing protein [Solirubrobacterales bacterium]
MKRARIAVLSLVLFAVGASPAAAAGAVTWVVKGGGFGHGVGMSAYGAYGYGEHGAGYQQILHHYFQGIRIKAVQGAPLVRVLLTISPGDVSFSRGTAACGHSLDPSRTYTAHRRGSSIRLLTGSGKLFARCGERLHADSGGIIRIGGVGTYRGALDLVPTESAAGSLNVVNRLNVNSYARGSVPAEVPPEWPSATLKAFAVACRSIALSTDVGGNGFDLYADTRTQVYGGVKVEDERTDRAVRATRGQVAMYGGAVAQTTYFSSSGGRTESGFLGAPDVPYLQSVEDPYDYYSPLHEWTFRFSQAEMNSRLGAYVDGALRGIRVTQRGDSPRIDYAKLVGTRGVATIRGDTLAAALGLYDRWAYFRKVRSGGR